MNMRMLETQSNLEDLATIGGNDEGDIGTDSLSLTVVFSIITTAVVTLMITVSTDPKPCC